MGRVARRDIFNFRGGMTVPLTASADQGPWCNADTSAAGVGIQLGEVDQAGL